MVSEAAQLLVDEKEHMGICNDGKNKSEAFESTHSSAEALLKIDAIDEATMVEFDQACIAEVPVDPPIGDEA